MYNVCACECVCQHVMIKGIKRVTLEEILTHSERDVQREPHGRSLVGSVSSLRRGPGLLFGCGVLQSQCQVGVMFLIHPRPVFLEPDEAHVRRF